MTFDKAVWILDPDTSEEALLPYDSEQSKQVMKSALNFLLSLIKKDCKSVTRRNGMTYEEAARILDPETSREALLPYAYDPQYQQMLLRKACVIAANVLEGYAALTASCPEGDLTLPDSKTFKIKILGLPRVSYEPATVQGKWEPTVYPFMAECEDCSVCGYRTVYGHGFKFCPNCGTKMDLEDNS